MSLVDTHSIEAHDIALDVLDNLKASPMLNSQDFQALLRTIGILAERMVAIQRELRE